jgi:hypothetical protein
MKKHLFYLNNPKSRPSLLLLFFVLQSKSMEKLTLKIPSKTQSLDSKSHAKFNIRNYFETNYMETLKTINELITQALSQIRSSLLHRAELTCEELLTTSYIYEENIKSFFAYIESNHYEDTFKVLAYELTDNILRNTRAIFSNFCSLANEFYKHTFPLEHDKFFKDKLALFEELLNKNTKLSQETVAQILKKSS